MYKLLFVIIALFLIMLAVYNCKITEGFADTTVPITSANIDEYVYKVYKADVKAIQNLADIAMKLQAGGVTVPGNMTVQNTLGVQNNLSINGDIIFNQTNNGQNNGSYQIFNNEPNSRVKGANGGTRGLYIYGYGPSGKWGAGATDNYQALSLQPGSANVYTNLSVSGNTTITGSLSAGATTINGGLSAGATTLGNLDATKMHAIKNDTWLGYDDNHNYLRGGTFLTGGMIGEGGDFSKAMTIDKDGNVVINGSIRIKDRIYFNNASNYWIEGGKDNDGHDTGSVSMTTWSPANEQRWINFTNDGNICVQPSGRGSSCISCDIRIKENIIDADSNDILNKINKLPMQNYNFNDKRYYDGNTVYGLVAQDV